MATVTKFANANAVVTTGWTNPTNAYADDAVYATAAPAKNVSVTSDYGFPAFTTGDIPTGSQIVSVKAEIQYKSDVTTSTGSTIGVQVNRNGTLQGTEQTAGMVTTDTLLSHTVSTGISLADLQTANFVKTRVAGKRAASNTAITWSIDYVSLTVTYNPPLTGSPSGITTAEAFGSVVSTFRASPQEFLVHQSFLGGVSGLRGLGTGAFAKAGYANGISSGEAFGSVTVSGGAIVPTGIPSGEAFGTPVFSGLLTVSPSGIVTAEAFGVPKEILTVSPSGIASLEAFGTPVFSGLLTVLPSGIVTAEAFGVPKEILTVSPSGIISVETFGVPAFSGVLTVLPSGITTGEIFGADSVNYIYLPVGIISGETLGLPTAVKILLVTPVAIGSGGVFGSTVASISNVGVIFRGRSGSRKVWNSR